jgi:hypothetical protein
VSTNWERRRGVTQHQAPEAAIFPQSPSSTVDEGAQAVLNLATSPAVEGRTGLYFNGRVRQKRRPEPTMRMRVGASRR